MASCPALGPVRAVHFRRCVSNEKVIYYCSKMKESAFENTKSDISRCSGRSKRARALSWFQEVAVVANFPALGLVRVL